MPKQSHHHQAPKRIILQKQNLIKNFFKKLIKRFPSFVILREWCPSPFLRGKVGSDCTTYETEQSMCRGVSPLKSCIIATSGASCRYAVIIFLLKDGLAERRWRGVSWSLSLVVALSSLSWCCWIYCWMLSAVTDGSQQRLWRVVSISKKLIAYYHSFSKETITSSYNS